MKWRKADEEDTRVRAKIFQAKEHPVNLKTDKKQRWCSNSVDHLENEEARHEATAVSRSQTTEGAVWFG